MLFLKYKFTPYIIAWIGIFCVYVMTQPHVLSLAHDSIGILTTYEDSIRSGITKDWFPAFYFLNRFLTLSVLSILNGWGVSVFHGVLVFNAAFSALSILGFYRVCKNGLRLKVSLSRGLSIALGVTFGVWGYINTVEVYALSFCVAVWVLGEILERKEGRKNYIILGLFVGFSALFHIRYVFLGLCVLARRPNRKEAGWFFVVSASVFLIPLLVSGALSQGLSSQAGIVYSLGLTSFAHVGIGILRVFIGGHFLMSEYFGDKFLHSVMPMHHLADEFFLVRHASITLIQNLTGLFLMFLAYMAVVVGLCVFSLPKVWRDKQKELSVLGVGLVSFTILALYADPVPVDQYIFHSVLILGLLGLVLPHYPKATSWILSTFIACLAILNYAGSMHFLRSIDNDYFYNDYQEIQALATKDTLVVYDFDFYYHQYHSLFKGKQQVVYLNTIDLNTFENDLSDAKLQGLSVLIHSRAITSTPYLEHRYSINSQAVFEFWKNYEEDLHPIQSTSGTLYYCLYD